MTFFTPLQLRVLKTSLIFVLLSYGLSLLSLPANLAFAAKLIGLISMIGWEFIIARRWKDFAIITLVTSMAFGAQYLIDAENWALVSHLNVFTAWLLAIITRFHLIGSDNKLSAGILATFIFYFLPKTGNPFHSGFFFTGLPVSSDAVYIAVSSLLLLWFKAICYYAIIFLVDNGFKWKAFFGKLPSKIQVFNKWEYLFMWMATYFAYMGCIGDLSTRVGMLFDGERMPVEPTWLSLLFLIATVFFLYAGALLLRNIIIGRALTVGKYSPWMLLLHLLPGVNIIAVAICFFAPEKQETFMGNAVDYVNVKRQYAKNAMIAVGILITAYNIYNMLVVPTGLRLLAIGILACLYLLKIGAYIKLPSGKTFVYVVVGLNILTIAYSINEHFIIYLSLIYLYYYFLLELFYPELEVEDMVQIAEKEG